MLFPYRASRSLEKTPSKTGRSQASSLLGRTTAIILLSMLAACKSGVKLDQDASAKSETAGAVSGSLDASATQSAPIDDSNVEEEDTAAAEEVATPITENSIYFDFDQYTVKESYQAVLQKHAQYLKAHSDLRLRIQGFSDERGTPEYNLALGQRRAEAVRQALVLLGIPASKLEAISFGKEKPKASGHDEAAWAQNRRADLVYSR